MSQLVTTEQDKQDLKAVMSSTSGRRFVMRVIYRACDVYSDHFNWQVHDGACLAAHQAHGAGQRSVGLNLLNEIQQHAPDELVQARRESDAEWLADIQERRAKATPSAGEKKRT